MHLSIKSNEKKLNSCCYNVKDSLARWPGEETLCDTRGRAKRCSSGTCSKATSFSRGLFRCRVVGLWICVTDSVTSTLGSKCHGLLLGSGVKKYDGGIVRPEGSLGRGWWRWCSGGGREVLGHMIACQLGRKEQLHQYLQLPLPVTPIEGLYES